jgi:pimeloyl-ACP methyl ester carboxylesterase
MAAAKTSVSRVDVAGTSIFYRQNGPVDASAPTILLLHGFPSSSHQFRNVIPLLATQGYRVIAPDLPGYGFTTVPTDYVHSFANLASTIEGFVDALELKEFAVYIFDYGAPTGLRLALRQPERIKAIVSQNGNAYDEGFGAKFWADIRRYWESGAAEDREKLRPLLELWATKWQYENGSSAPEKIQPEAYWLDQALLDRPGSNDVQLDLLYDYRTNLEFYPKFQQYFRDSDVPVLAMWGRNDEIFVAPGAEAFRRDVKKLEVRFLEAGHFALEGKEEEAVGIIDEFFKKFGVFDI